MKYNKRMKYLITLFFLVSTLSSAENFRFDCNEFGAKRLQFITDDKTWDCTDKIQDTYGLTELEGLYSSTMDGISEPIFMEDAHYMVVLTYDDKIKIYDIHTGRAKLIKEEK